ncbi:MAG: (2Fe-2S) ferredoxin domain-containing protein, partial [Chloroflexi bacterium]|nr:(2Fe-2S) ferredoxin domain-containing protein [Chloroflexota bacterium]
MSAVSSAYESLRHAARQRLSEREGKRRVVVQAAHCSQSVGADEVAAALSKSLPGNAYLVIAGCDGACFDGPQVIVTEPSGETRRYARATPDSVSQVL